MPGMRQIPWPKDVHGQLIPPDYIVRDVNNNYYDHRYLNKVGSKVTYRTQLLFEDHSGHAEKSFQAVPPADFVNEYLANIDQEPTAGYQEIALPLRPRAYSEQHVPRLVDMDLDKVPKSTFVRTLAQPHLQKYTTNYSDDGFYSSAAQFIKTAHQTDFLVEETKRKYGFDAEDIILWGGLFCSPCRPSNLVATKLAIFRSENFFDTPQDVLDTLQPALALAEKILVKCPRFWYNVLHGERVAIEKPLQASQRRYEMLTRINFADLRPSEHANIRATTLQSLQEFGNRLRVTFEEHDACRTLGFTHLPHMFPWKAKHNFESPPSLPADPWQQPVRISMHPDFYHLAKRFSKIIFKDVAAYLRYCFVFAIVFLHELSHAFERNVGNAKYYRILQQEPIRLGSGFKDFPQRDPEATYFADQETPEIGICFERETFGGRIWPINYTAGVEYGVALVTGLNYLQDRTFRLEDLQEQEECARVIPMGYIEEIQQESFWSKDEVDLSVPALGLSSTHGVDTSTTPWRSYLLEKEERDQMDITTVGPESKKVRLEKPATKARTARKVRPPIKVQTKLQRYPRSTHPDLPAIKQELQAELEVRREEEEAARVAAQRAEKAPVHAQPEPKKKDLWPFLELYKDADESSSDEGQKMSHPDYDPLHISPEKLSLADKWILAEEWCGYSHGWDTDYFLAMRHRGNLRSSLLPVRLHPENPHSWTIDDQSMLNKMRMQNPSQSFPARRKQISMTYEHNKRLTRIVQEMEEYVVRKGSSRISFLREVAEKGIPAEIDEWDKQFRPLLLTAREQERLARRASASRSDTALELTTTVAPDPDLSTHTGEVNRLDRSQKSLLKFFKPKEIFLQELQKQALEKAKVEEEAIAKEEAAEAAAIAKAKAEEGALARASIAEAVAVDSVLAETGKHTVSDVPSKVSPSVPSPLAHMSPPETPKSSEKTPISKDIPSPDTSSPPFTPTPMPRPHLRSTPQLLLVRSTMDEIDGLPTSPADEALASKDKIPLLTRRYSQEVLSAGVLPNKLPPTSDPASTKPGMMHADVPRAQSDDARPTIEEEVASEPPRTEGEDKPISETICVPTSPPFAPAPEQPFEPEPQNPRKLSGSSSSVEEALTPGGWGEDD